MLLCEVCEFVKCCMGIGNMGPAGDLCPSEGQEKNFRAGLGWLNTTSLQSGQEMPFLGKADDVSVN